ncbi:MAG: protein kinase, partial [Verrucomicrobiota bacterium]
MAGNVVKSVECIGCGRPTEPGSLGAVCPRCLFGQARDSSAPGNGPTPGIEFEPLTNDELGEMMPQFEIHSLIGRGGMGLVYKARQKNLERWVAIKLLPVEAALDAEFEDRFMREARMMAKLDHANITHIYDFGEVDGLYYIIMEYVEGRHLAMSLINESLPLSESVGIVLQISEALSYAHSRGVIHRDIKPANLMITGEGRVKVMDFGLAKLIGASADGPADITRTQASLGTPHYMAPEQHKSLQTADHRADIYSLGVVLYELLTGNLPIGRFALPSDLALVSPAVDQVVLKALEPDPDSRYGNVQDFQNDLLASAESLDGKAGDKQVALLLFTDIVDSVGLGRRLGQELYVDCITRHDALIKEVIDQIPGARVLQHTGDGYLIRFGAPSEGVAAALRIQFLMAEEPWPEERLRVRIGLHLGEVVEITESNTGVTKPVGFAINLASRVSSLAMADQILMTRVVFDDARQYLREHPAVDGHPESGRKELQWPAHGRYLFQGSEEPTEVFEVGTPGIAPLQPPGDSDKIKRAVAADEEQTLGWRP